MTLADYLNTDEIARDRLADRVREQDKRIAELEAQLAGSVFVATPYLAKVQAERDTLAELVREYVNWIQGDGPADFPHDTWLARARAALEGK